MSRTTATTPLPLEERQLVARTAAAVWASIGVVGLVATIGPLGSSTEHVDEMRLLGGAAGVMAAALLLLPTRMLATKLLTALPALMTLCVGALAYAGGAARGDLTILLTFVVVFSAYFFSHKASVAHIGLIALVLVSRLFLVTEDGGRVETIRFAILLPALVTVWGLVSILRKNLMDREARLRAQEVYDPETGVFSTNGLDQVLDAELARATRHARPLSLVNLEVSGAEFGDADDETVRRVATAIARALVGRIRAEDRAARLGDLRFGVIAIETGESGAAVLARSLAEQVRKRLLSLGYDGGSFTVAVGWADFQHVAGSKHQLYDSAGASLASAVPADEGISIPVQSRPPPATVPTLEPAH